MSIKISTTKTYNPNSFKQKYNRASEYFKKEGKEYLKSNNCDMAINSFKKGIEADKSNVSLYFEIAKAYGLKKDFNNSVIYYDKYLEFVPDDIEALSMQGEDYKKIGYYNKAENNFKKALMLDKNYDLAKRNLLETQNLKKFLKNPTDGMNEKIKQANTNLSVALSIAAQYLPRNYLKNLNDVEIAFDKTAKLSGRANIAQYEHNKRRISVTEDYIWASPQIVSAYLIHEFVHASDNDPYTSIKEEQDAFEAATKFWIKNSKNIKDPELDFAKELYLQSPQNLFDRIEEIYLSRDPYITKTSPNHPPGRSLYSGTISSQNSHSLKNYDVIA